MQIDRQKDRLGTLTRTGRQKKKHAERRIEGQREADIDTGRKTDSKTNWEH